MLPENDERKFDEMLKYSLKKHQEPISDDFARELLGKVEKIQQQKILNRIIMQERISLAAFILLPLIILAIMFAFPFLITSAGQSIANICIFLIESFNIIIKHGQICCYYSMVVILGLYAVYQMLETEH